MTESLMTRMPPTPPSSKGLVASAARARASESRQRHRSEERRTSRGYRERNIASARARLPRRRASAATWSSSSLVALEGFIFFEKVKIAFTIHCRQQAERVFRLLLLSSL